MTDNTEKKEAKKMDLNTPMLDQLEDGPWPSFVTDLKGLSEKRPQVGQLLNQLEESYENRWNYWDGMVENLSGYGGGIICRTSQKSDQYPDLNQFHTIRLIPPPGFVYNTKKLRELADIGEKHGAGIMQFHGMTGDLLALGFDTESAFAASEDYMKAGFDLGGSGAALRTLQCCVGQARCEMACFDTMKSTRFLTNRYIDFLHLPEFMYKFKIKISGCANDCANATHRSDMPIIGTWRGPMQVDQTEVAEFIDEKGIEYVIDNVLTRCPTHCLSLKDNKLVVDNDNCVRCMHCINVMNRALKPGKDKGVSLLLGGKRTLKIGDTMSSMIVPFIKLETEEDFENLADIIDRIWEFWNDYAHDHERVSEFISRVGLAAFLDGVGLEPDPCMVAQTRTSPFIKFEELAPGPFEGEQEQNPSVWEREPETVES